MILVLLRTLTSPTRTCMEYILALIVDTVPGLKALEDAEDGRDVSPLGSDLDLCLDPCFAPATGTRLLSFLSCDT